MIYGTYRIYIYICITTRYPCGFVFCVQHMQIAWWHTWTLLACQETETSKCQPFFGIIWWHIQISTSKSVETDVRPLLFPTPWPASVSSAAAFWWKAIWCHWYLFFPMYLFTRLPVNKQRENMQTKHENNLLFFHHVSSKILSHGESMVWINIIYWCLLRSAMGKP